MLLHLSPALALIQPPLFLQPPCKCSHPHVLSCQLQQGCPLCPQYSQTASYCIPPRFCLTTSLFSDSLPSVSTSMGLLKLFWKPLLPAAFSVGISQLFQQTFSDIFSRTPVLTILSVTRVCLRNYLPTPSLGGLAPSPSSEALYSPRSALATSVNPISAYASGACNPGISLNRLLTPSARAPRRLPLPRASTRDSPTPAASTQRSSSPLAPSPRTPPPPAPRGPAGSPPTPTRRWAPRACLSRTGPGGARSRLGTPPRA